MRVCKTADRHLITDSDPRNRAACAVVVALGMLIGACDHLSSVVEPGVDLAAIKLIPSSRSLVVGEQANFEARGYDTSGREVDGITLKWEVEDDQVATVDDGGRMTAVAVGTTLMMVNAACCEIADTTTVSVVPEPTVDEDFSQWASVDDFIEAVTAGGRGIGEEHMSLIEEGPPSISDGAIQYTFPDEAESEDPCRSRTIGFSYDLRPLTSEAERKEVWMEVWYRFSENWTTKTNDGCDKEFSSWKTVFGQVFGGSGRFQFKHGQGGRGANITFATPPYPGASFQNNEPVDSREQWDGNWYRLRLHMRLSSDDGISDGRMRAWIDDELIWDSGPHEIGRSEIWGIAVGRNRDAAREEMTAAFSGLRVWIDDPGW